MVTLVIIMVELVEVVLEEHLQILTLLLHLLLLI
tara:strand:- start:291 stop:392 length:102 start_codon:yes stop_codon:yes gene_type:complete